MHGVYKRNKCFCSGQKTKRSSSGTSLIILNVGVIRMEVVQFGLPRVLCGLKKHLRPSGETSLSLAGIRTLHLSACFLVTVPTAMSQLP
jgi:hypothetical protein